MIKFLYRLFINSLLLLLISLPLEIAGWFLLLPVCYLSKSNLLPSYLRWFDNCDYYLKRNTTTYDTVIASGWLNRYFWLAFRNPCNYFGYKVLGFQADFTIPKTGIGDAGGQTPGLFTTSIDGYYEYYYIKKWSSDKCFRFRMGWKLSNTNPGDWVERVFIIQPYKSYSGL